MEWEQIGAWLQRFGFSFSALRGHHTVHEMNLRVGGTGSGGLLFYSPLLMCHIRQAQVSVVFCSRSEPEREKMWASTSLSPPDLPLNPKGSPPPKSVWVCRISNWRINSEGNLFFFFIGLYDGWEITLTRKPEIFSSLTNIKSVLQNSFSLKIQPCWTFLCKVFDWHYWVKMASLGLLQKREPNFIYQLFPSQIMLRNSHTSLINLFQNGLSALVGRRDARWGCFAGIACRSFTYLHQPLPAWVLSSYSL